MLHEPLMQTPKWSRKYIPVQQISNVYCQNRAANMMHLRCSTAWALKPNYTAMKEEQ